jgi:hypothetical protein
MVRTRDRSINEVVCVLTHHSPVRKGTILPDEEFIGSAMATNLMHLMKPCVTFWGFGHTHRNADLIITTPHESYTRVASNQLGYINSNEDTIIKYDPEKVFTIADLP